MISISRVLVRTLRATFRKASDARGRSQSSVTFRADEAGLRIQSRAGSVGVEYRMDGFFPSESLALPLAALADFEGSKSTPVQFAGEPTGGVRVEWVDAGVPQRRVYVCHGAEPLVVPPRSLRPVGDGTVLVALNEAMSAAATSQVRYALTHVQLRGRKGEAVGTDGKQLLIVRGLGFPWTDDVLIPRTKLFEGKAFVEAASVEMARTEDDVVVRAGPWTAWLASDKTGRFPNVDSVIPREMGKATRIVLSDDDVEFLARTLPRLPCDDSSQSPVTVHANGQVVVRSRSESGPVTELVLNRSVTVGDEVRIVTDRTFLRRAAQLGIRNLRFVNDRTPVVGESDRHTYVWQPLDGKLALASSDDALRIESAATSPPQPDPQPTPRRVPAMSEKSNGPVRKSPRSKRTRRRRIRSRKLRRSALSFANCSDASIAWSMP
jgi:hypothetical protein